MPIYSYVCPGCGRQFYTARSIAVRDDPASCSNCDGPLRRLPDATQGLLARVPEGARPPQQPAGGPILINCSAIGNGGAAFHSSGGHVTLRNFVAVDNSGPAFDLKNGATVDVDGMVHIAHKDPEPPKPKKPRKRKSRRRKK